MTCMYVCIYIYNYIVCIYIIYSIYYNDNNNSIHEGSNQLSYPLVISQFAISNMDHMAQDGAPQLVGL